MGIVNTLPKCVESSSSPASCRSACSSSSSGSLDQVQAPPAEGTPRDVRVHATGGRVDSITDPDLTAVRFGYADATHPDRVTGRTDKRGTTTDYGYDAAGRVDSAHVHMGDTGQDIVVTLETADGRGLAPSAAAPERTYTLLDGPRTDVSDTTAFHLNRFHMPELIRDALGHETVLAREDGRFPALVTRVTHPNGRVVSASYDSLGHLASTTDSSVFRGPPGSREYATTRYAWDAEWDRVTKIVPPEGDSTVMAYDPATGNRAWQQDARGLVSRVEFLHEDDPGSPLFGMPRGVQPPETASGSGGPDPTHFAYDELGNLESVTTSLGFVTDYERDDVGRDTLVRRPVDRTRKAVMRTTYDVMGRALETERAGPAVQVQMPDSTSAVYDSAYTFPAGTVFVKRQYDAAGNLERVDRWAAPDTNSLGTITTEWIYDGANRKIVQVAPDGERDSTVHDAAGNVVERHTRRGHVITMRYDALNRRTRRVVPTMEPTASSEDVLLGWAYPLYRISEGTPTAEMIRGEVATFAYDDMGNLVEADNQVAEIDRSYDRAGRLVADTLRVATYRNLGFGEHVYGLRHGYDLDGRRVWTKHPGTIAPRVGGETRDSVAYSYTSFGAVETVRDVLGNAWTHAYDARGRLAARTTPDGFTETRAYDADGRMTRRREEAGSAFTHPVTGQSTTVLHADTLIHDARGKVTVAATVTDSFVMAYSGLGHLVHTQTKPDPLSGNVGTRDEQYVVGPLGNQRLAVRVAPDLGDLLSYQAADSARYHYEAGTGRRVGTNSKESETLGWAHYDETSYDAAGNEKIRRSETVADSLEDLLIGTRNYYRADGRLAAVDKRSCLFRWNGSQWVCDFTDAPGGLSARGTFEQHRYDALGRRILTRTRQDSACGSTACDRSIRRYVWDGQRLLYEIRYPAGGGSGPPAATVERDTGAVFGPGHGVAPYGRVAYTHGTGGVDRPLGMIRMGYATTTVGGDSYEAYLEPFLVVPHTSWRGRFDAGTVREDEPRFHGRFTAPTANNCADPEQPLTCLQIAWPGELTYAGFRYGGSRQAEIGWMGSLKDHHRDASGNLYRRNRYYDPQTGRFTHRRTPSAWPAG